MKGKSVTVVLDDVVVKKLHIIQSTKRKNEKSLVKNNKHAFSFSRVLNETLRKTLK